MRKLTNSAGNQIISPPHCICSLNWRDTVLIACNSTVYENWDLVIYKDVVTAKTQLPIMICTKKIEDITGGEKTRMEIVMQKR